MKVTVHVLDAGANYTKFEVCILIFVHLSMTVHHLPSACNFTKFTNLESYNPAVLLLPSQSGVWGMCGARKCGRPEATIGSKGRDLVMIGVCQKGHVLQTHNYASLLGMCVIFGPLLSIKQCIR